MSIAIFESPVLKQKKPSWLPYLSLFVTLYCIVMLQWDLKPIIFLFWWELILILVTALIRMLFALQDRSFIDNIGLKTVLLLLGIPFGSFFIYLTYQSVFKAFGAPVSWGFENIPIQISSITLGYLAGLIIHFFANKHYKSADPIRELITILVQLWILVAFLQGITVHLLPAYPSWNQSHWVVVAIVGVKFCVDLLFTWHAKVNAYPDYRINRR